MPKKKKPLTSEAQLRANAKYDTKFSKIVVRIDPSAKEIVQENIGEKSVNQYILDLIREDLKKKGIELP